MPSYAKLGQAMPSRGLVKLARLISFSGKLIDAEENAYYYCYLLSFIFFFYIGLCLKVFFGNVRILVILSSWKSQPKKICILVQCICILV